MNEFQMFFYYVRKLFEDPVIKAIFGAVIGWLYLTVKVLFGDDVYLTVLAGVGVLSAIDFVTGYSYARMNRSIMVESKRIRGSVYKMGFYAILLIVGHQCTVFATTTFIYGLFVGGIMYTEVLSICENLEKIALLTGTKIPFLTLMLRILRGKYEAIFTAASGDGKLVSETGKTKPVKIKTNGGVEDDEGSC